MIGDVGVHRADDAEVIGPVTDLGEDLAHFQAALPATAKFERRAHQAARLALGLRRTARHRLPVIARQHRFGIERIHLRHAAIHEEKNDALDLGREVRLFRGERVIRDGGGLAHATQAEDTEAASH